MKIKNNNNNNNIQMLLAFVKEAEMSDSGTINTSTPYFLHIFIETD